jgi:pimeloyl-ACP methyl ester carboxylesterase
MPSAPPALPPALAGERRTYRGRAGDSSAYVTGPARAAPLLLLHSVNAAASAYEVKPIYDRMAAERRVVAPDLPGFGFSDRSRRDYTIRLYTDSVHDALDLVAADSGDRPVDVLAVSLASEFAARATVEAPARVRSLTLVTPTGFARNVPTGAAQAGSREVPGLYRVVSFPLWGRPLFDLLTSRASIRYFLRRTYGSSDVDEAMVEYDWLSTRPPGAEHAPFAFLSGRLFSRDVQAVYRQLELPVWVPHATRGDFRDFSRSDWARARPNWRFQPMPTGAMPHFEQPEAFVQALRAFLAAADQAVSEA